ncbi:MAG: alpha/beta hydrolase [Myxococcales bacterium]|nr:alpha/beta hydrolase [Myxococcales bacterium]
MRATILLLLVGSGAAGCVRSYADAPALPYAEVPYVGPDGAAWPEEHLTLDGVAAHYRMKSTPTITYVELNPEGAKTLIFVHGLGSYLKFWQPQLNHFAALGYRVVALDMVGYGKSDKPGSFPYTMEAMADVVLALRQHLGGPAPVLVGHSMGGQTALSYAIRYPDQLSALVLTSPAGFETFSAREKAWFRKVFATTLVTLADEHAIWGAIRENNFDRWRDDLEWLIEERVRTAKNDDFEAYAYANVRSVHGLLENDFVRQSLEHVTVPTLIVHGDADRLIPNRFLHAGATVDVMRVGADRIPDATLITLPGCGHTVQLDCPADYNAAVEAFLKAR